MPGTHRPTQNRLLESLPAADLRRLLPYLELIQMEVGDVLYESGASSRYVYFPTTSIVSLMYLLGDGASAEIGVVGNDGVIGIAIFMGGDSTPSRAVVQNDGYGYRLDARYLKTEFERAGALLRVLLRYTQALLTQMAQTSVCNRHHSVDQQLCRWLLMRLDRLHGSTIKVTQEVIGGMLGVRREGVTEAAGRLQRAGIIRYSRGRIDVLDRTLLETRVCECYGAYRQESDRLLQPP